MILYPPSPSGHLTAVEDEIIGAGVGVLIVTVAVTVPVLVFLSGVAIGTGDTSGNVEFPEREVVNKNTPRSPTKINIISFI